MSTTFDVFPRTARLPTFSELLGSATSVLRDRLADAGIELSMPLCFKVMDQKRHRDQKLGGQDTLQWPDGTYAWFYLDGLAGGTDAYFQEVDDVCRGEWLEDLRGVDRAAARFPWIKECLTAGHYWSFRRSVGQSATINLAYGLIAGALARMTDGFIWSDDSAWDHECFPATGSEFLSCYFRPELAISPDFREWAERSWTHIPDEIRESRDGAGF